MGLQLTIEQVRQMYNIPKFMPDSEVLNIAMKNNIQITFGGVTNTADLKDLKDGNSVFNAKGSTTTNTTTGGGLFGDNISFGNTSKGFSTPSLGGDLSGNFGATKNFASNGLGKDYAADFKAKANSFAPKLSFDIDLFKQNLSDVESGKDLNTKNTEKWEYADGMAYRLDENGNRITEQKPGEPPISRKAAFGEEGYQKDGESIDERIQRCYPKAVKEAKTPEQKAKLLHQYFKGYYDHLKASGKYTDEQIKNLQRKDFDKLLRNSDQKNGEYGKIMGVAIHSLRADNRVEALDNSMNYAQNENVEKDIVMSLMNTIEESGDNPEAQRELLSRVKSHAQRLGIQGEVSLTAAGKIAVCGDNQCALIDIVDLYGNSEAIGKLREQIGATREDGSRVLSGENETYALQASARHIQSSEDAQNHSATIVRATRENQISATEYTYEVLSENQELTTEFNNATAENVAEYDKENALKVQDMVIEHDDEEMSGAQRMANHGHELDTEIQKEFVEKLINLNNEKVSTNVANHAYEYDLSNRDDIIKMIKEQGYESTQKALDDARKEYEAQIAEEKAKAEVAEALKKQQTEKAEKNNKENSETKVNKQATTTSTINISNKKAKVSARELTEAVASGSSVNAIILSDKFRNADPQDRAAFYNNLSVKDKQMAISSIVEKSNAITLKSLMFSGMKKSILSYLVSHPSSDNNAKLKYLENYLAPADKKELEDLKEKQQLNVQAQREEVENKQHKPFMFEV